jgi:endonuclease/exonuclease/phosphatase family metal-dependent hydrolase
MAFINQAAGDNPVILLGDFNDLSNSEPIGIVLAAGFIDTYPAVNSEPAYTWDELLNANIQTHYLKEKTTTNARRDRIDYILSRGNELKIRASKVVLNQLENDLHPSDHFGVMTIFEVQNR